MTAIIISLTHTHTHSLSPANTSKNRAAAGTRSLERERQRKEDEIYHEKKNNKSRLVAHMFAFLIRYFFSVCQLQQGSQRCELCKLDDLQTDGYTTHAAGEFNESVLHYLIHKISDISLDEANLI